MGQPAQVADSAAALRSSPVGHRPLSVGDYAIVVGSADASGVGPLTGSVLRFRGGRVTLRLHGKGTVRAFARDDVVRHPGPNQVILDWFHERPPVVVVACGAAKRSQRSPAGDLYLGSYHRLARSAAASVAARTGGEVLILSAKHGLVSLHDELDPYDVRVGDAGSVAAADVHRQLRDLDVRRVVALTPSGYTELLRSRRVWLVDPLAGSRGMFEQNGRLAAIRDGRLPVPVQVTEEELVRRATRSLAGRSGQAVDDHAGQESGLR